MKEIVYVLMEYNKNSQNDIVSTNVVAIFKSEPDAIKIQKKLEKEEILDRREFMSDPTEYRVIPYMLQ